MEPKLEKRNEAGGERAVEKPLRGKVHTTDFFTSIGNPPNPRISTFPQPRRRRLVIFYLEDWRTKTQTRPRPRVTYRKPKMVLTMGSTLPRLSFNKVVVTRYRIFLENRYLAAGTINGRLAAVRRLAYEAADAGLLSPELAAGIRRVKGAKKLGVRLGNWLTAE